MGIISEMSENTESFFSCDPLAKSFYITSISETAQLYPAYGIHKSLI